MAQAADEPEVLDTGDIESASRSEGDRNPNNVAGGLKATINNPNNHSFPTSRGSNIVPRAVTDKRCNRLMTSVLKCVASCSCVSSSSDAHAPSPSYFVLSRPWEPDSHQRARRSVLGGSWFSQWSVAVMRRPFCPLLAYPSSTFARLFSLCLCLLYFPPTSLPPFPCSTGP